MTVHPSWLVTPLEYIPTHVRCGCCGEIGSELDTTDSLTDTCYNRGKWPTIPSTLWDRLPKNAIADYHRKNDANEAAKKTRPMDPR